MKTRDNDAASVHRSMPDRVATMVAGYRRGGRRARTIRRVMALVLLLMAGVMALSVPGSAATGTRVYAAARDLAIGHTLTAEDLTVVTVRSPPHGALATDAELTGRLTAGPVRAGEVLTDARLVDDGGLEPGPGRSAVPIRLSDAGVAALLRPGMPVTLISIGEDGRAQPLTGAAVVLAVPGREDSGPRNRADDRLVVVAVPEAAADGVSAAALTHSVALRFGAN